MDVSHVELHVESTARIPEFQSLVNSIEHSWYTSLKKLADVTANYGDVFQQRLQVVMIAYDWLENLFGVELAVRVTSAAIRLAEIRFQLEEDTQKCVESSQTWKGTIP